MSSSAMRTWPPTPSPTRSIRTCVRNNPDVDYDYFYDFLTNYEENVYAKVEANAAQ